MSELPLSGIRIVEMSHMVMGPACGFVLAQLGAEVIKVEPEAGDKTRILGGMGTAFFPIFNRGKKSVVLNLKSPEGKSAMLKLLETADIFIENFKDDTIAKLGLDSATISKRMPNLIFGAHKGYLSGPYEHRPATDEVVQMLSGLAYMTGSRERPLRVGASMNDMMGGMFGAIGILAALLERERTSKGKEIRIGLFENSLFAVSQHMVQFLMTGEPVPPMPQRTHAWPVYDIFDTADERRLFIGVTTEVNWQVFCKALELDDMLSDPRLETITDRINARSWTIPTIAEKIKSYRSQELQNLLDSLSISFAPINAPHEMYSDPHVKRKGGLVDIINHDGKIYKTPALPLELNGTGLTGNETVPKLGEHTDEVLSSLDAVAE